MEDFFIFSILLVSWGKLIVYQPKLTSSYQFGDGFCPEFSEWDRIILPICQFSAADTIEKAHFESG